MLMQERTVSQEKKMSQPSVLARNRAPQASLSMEQRGPRLMWLLPIIEAAPHGPLQGGLDVILLLPQRPADQHTVVVVDV